ncbi:hypothetical protein LTS18_014038, partial [Coniosporium uncinatum]
MAGEHPRIKITDLKPDDGLRRYIKRTDWSDLDDIQAFWTWQFLAFARGETFPLGTNALRTFRVFIDPWAIESSEDHDAESRPDRYDHRKPAFSDFVMCPVWSQDPSTSTTRERSELSKLTVFVPIGTVKIRRAGSESWEPTGLALILSIPESELWIISSDGKPQPLFAERESLQERTALKLWGTEALYDTPEYRVKTQIKTSFRSTIPFTILDARLDDDGKIVPADAMGVASVESTSNIGEESARDSRSRDPSSASRVDGDSTHKHD